MVPESSPSVASDDMEGLFSSASPAAPDVSLQRQPSTDLLQSLLPELFTWTDSLQSLQSLDFLSNLASPASTLSEDLSLLQSDPPEHAAGEIGSSTIQVTADICEISWETGGCRASSARWQLTGA